MARIFAGIIDGGRARHDSSLLPTTSEWIISMDSDRLRDPPGVCLHSHAISYLIGKNALPKIVYEIAAGF